MKISIILPTLNEEHFIRRTIQHAIARSANPDLLELIVVDAGSTDLTLTCIADLPVMTVTDDGLRLKKYESLNRGIAKASGEVVLFLDADTLLPKHFDTLIHNALSKKKCVGGAFEMRFINADLKLSLLSHLNAVRYRIWKTCYGDQAVFCRKEAAESISGFPPTLMEAAYFCRRLKKMGTFKIINPPVLTSPRRFDEYGFWKVFWFDFTMWVRFVFNHDLSSYSATYWKINLTHG